MIRALIAVTLLAGLFPAQGHRFVEIACNLVSTISKEVGGREPFILLTLIIFAGVYIGTNRRG